MGNLEIVLECNKTTFYYHFETFDSLKGQCIELFFQRTPPSTCLSVLASGGLRSDDLEMFDSLCTMLALNHAGEFRRTLHNAAADRARAILSETGLSDVQVNLRTELVADGILSIMAYRGRNGNQIEPSELAKAVACFIA